MSSVINAKDNGDGTISFESNKFSTYALAYEDTQIVETPVDNTEVPQTYDASTTYLIVGLVSLVSVALIVVYLKKQIKNN